MSNYSIIFDVISYPFYMAYKGFLVFQVNVGIFARMGNDFAKVNIDPYINYATKPLQSYKKIVTNLETQKIIDSSAEFAVCRLPNYKEAITSVLTQATINFFSGRAKTAFGNNPTASAIIRDVSKLPITEANVAANNTFGFTNNTYSLGSLYASRTKVACKALLIASIPIVKIPFKTWIKHDLTFEEGARGANYICEIPSRYLHIVEKRKQYFEKQNPDLPEEEFFEFAQKNMDVSLILESVGEAVIKATASDQLGEIYKNIGYERYIKEGVALIDNSIATIILGVKVVYFEAQDDIYTKAYKYIIASIEISSSYGVMVAASAGSIAFSISFIVGFIGQVTIESIAAYGLGAPTRICQDSAGLAIKNSYNYVQKPLDIIVDYCAIKEIIDLYSNKTPISGEVCEPPEDYLVI